MTGRRRAVAVGLVWPGWILAIALVAGATHADPSLDYTLHCRGCHLEDGRETPGAVPALAGRMGRFLSVPGGRAYLVRVPGTAHSPLDDAEVASLLNWMLRRFDPGSLPPDFAPYTRAEVTRHRADPLVEVAAERAALLRAMAVREPDREPVRKPLREPVREPVREPEGKAR